MLCKECGKELGAGEVKCPNCGALQEPGVEAPAAVPPGAKPKKKWLIPIVAGVCVAVVVAVVLVLVFVVFKGSSPDKTVQKFFTEFENKNASGITALADPEAFKKESGSKDAFEKLVKASLPQGDVKFENLVFDTSITGDEATVELTKGTVRQEDETGKIVSASVTEAGVQTTFYLMKSGGGWYFSGKTFPNLWAGYYVEKADKSLGRLGSGIDEMKAEVDDLFAHLAEGVMSYKGLDQKYKDGSEDIIASLDGLSGKAKGTRSLYAKVAALEDVEQYKEYAGVRERQVDGAVKIIDKYKEYLQAMGDYTGTLAANPQTSPAEVEQTMRGIQNRYLAELQALDAEYGSLNQEAEGLKAGLGL
ncbi:MAG: zinc ribbon domain-containing protein [Actinobacteria bacterium]|nr:zinc ribbon domain-containing protein [Actinomycetota bacterium]